MGVAQARWNEINPKEYVYDFYEKSGQTFGDGNGDHEFRGNSQLRSSADR